MPSRSRLSRINRSSRRVGTRRLRQPSLYSRTEEVKEKRPLAGIFRGLILTGALVGTAYLVFFSGIFSVNKITYSPTKYIDRGALDHAIRINKLPIIDDNIITFGLFGLSDRAEKVTGVSKTSVRRVGQHEIVVTVVEKAPLLVWQTLGRKYLVDDTGLVWADYQEKYQTLPLVIDTKNLPVKIGDKVLPQSFANFFEDLVTSFTNETGTKADKFEVMDIVSDLRVTTDAGWYVYFDTSRTAKNELVSLKRVLTEVRSNGSSLEYVDLRINNRIFYK